MPILRNLGFLVNKTSLTGAEARSAIEAVRGYSYVSARFGVLPFDFYNRNKPGPPVAPPAPLYSGSFDMSAFVRCLARVSDDMCAEITALGGVSGIRARVIGSVVGAIGDLGAYILGYAETGTNLAAWVRCVSSDQTEPVTYEKTLLATRSGFSILYRLLTTLPDITATISGWVSSDLGATLRVIMRTDEDFLASIFTVTEAGFLLWTSITAVCIESFIASITAVEPSDLEAAITAIGGVSLGATTVPVPPKDLFAFCGGHVPSDIAASLLVNPPVDFAVFIRSSFADYSDLAATITGFGGFYDLRSLVRASFYSNSEVWATIICKVPTSFRAYIHGWDQLDLIASVTGVYSADIGGWITPWYRNNMVSMAAFIRPTQTDQSSMSCSLYGWISAHTTDKPYNYNILPRPYRKIWLAQKKGLTILQIEPIRGIFPDLHATLIAVPLNIKYLYAFIRGMSPTYSDITASLSAVTRPITISKLTINFVNLSDLFVTISAFSGFKPMYCSINGVAHVHTTTASNAGWVYISSSIRFYLGTNKGLYVPDSIVRTIRYERFVNNSLLPDLWAYAYGWASSDLSATLTVQPYSSLLASLSTLDLTHVKELVGSIYGCDISSLLASISTGGGYYDCTATISVAGCVSALNASIYPHFQFSGYRIIPVETKPFYDLYATINTIASCGHYSTYSNISCFIRGMNTIFEGVFLAAEINSLSNINDIQATIIGRKLTRISILDLMFRTKIRSNSSMYVNILGIGSTTLDIFSSIVGKPLEADIMAAITACRYVFSRTEEAELIDVYSIYKGVAQTHKRLRLMFASQIERYVYDAIDRSLYKIGDGKWVLNLSELTDSGLFYDRNVNDRDIDIDNINEYASIDEAIRAAISMLIDYPTDTLFASITASGGFSSIFATISGISQDRVVDLRGSLTIVENLPDLYASITAYSGYLAMRGYITGYASFSSDVSVDIRGVVEASVTAEITAVS